MDTSLKGNEIKIDIQNFLITSKEKVEKKSEDEAIHQIINLLIESTVENITWYREKNTASGGPN